MAAPRRAVERGPAKAASTTKGKRSPPRAFTPKAARAHEALEREVVRIFPEAERATGFGMRGWKIPRRRRVEDAGGAIDPNFVHLYLVERKTGITLHVWNPIEPGALHRSAAPLKEAGFHLMVGCLQFNRQAEFPAAAVVPLLEDARRIVDSEAS